MCNKDVTEVEVKKAIEQALKRDVGSEIVPSVKLFYLKRISCLRI